MWNDRGRKNRPSRWTRWKDVLFLQRPLPNKISGLTCRGQTRGEARRMLLNTPPLKSASYHSIISRFLFLICSTWLIGLGLYFMFLRPPLLPEDWRYMGINAADVQSSLPMLKPWLRRVFTVLGGFITSTGLLTLLMTIKAGAIQEKWTWIFLALTGFFSVGTMSLINYQLDSDFKWLLLLPSLLWSIGLLLKRQKNTSLEWRCISKAVCKIGMQCKKICAWVWIWKKHPNYLMHWIGLALQSLHNWELFHKKNLNGSGKSSFDEFTGERLK